LREKYQHEEFETALAGAVRDGLIIGRSKFHFE
jgi:hypothetical protein